MAPSSSNAFSSASSSTLISVGAESSFNHEVKSACTECLAKGTTGKEPMALRNMAKKASALPSADESTTTK